MLLFVGSLIIADFDPGGHFCWGIGRVVEFVNFLFSQPLALSQGCDVG